MSRPLRIEFPGALYHVTACGDQRQPVYEDDRDRQRFLDILAEVVARYDWVCHSYCLMADHYQLLVETPEANLSQGMRQLNGVYTQAVNRRHGRVGHLFQGRFRGILVDKDAYLLELARYLVLNPVRAGLAGRPEDWAWSSYRAVMGLSPAPEWLAVGALLRQFGRNRETARAHYRRFVLAGLDVRIWDGLRQQIYLGDEAFVERMQGRAKIQGDELSVPRTQRRPPVPPLAKIAASADRDSAIVAAHATGAYSYRVIAEHFGIHPATVGRIVRRAVQQIKN